MAETYSLKEAFGGKDSEAYKNYKEGQKAGKWADYNDYISKGGNSTSTPDKALSDSISRMVSANQQAVAPAVQSYQAAIPETQASFAQQRSQLEAEKTPLQERFNNLLAKVKGTFQGQRDLTTTTTNNELGRRGIVASSGLADKTLEEALKPIFAAEGQATTDIGLEQEAALRDLQNRISNLSTEEQGSIRNILNAIATLQSNAGLTGVTQGIQGNQFDTANALQRLQLSQSADQFGKSYDLQKNAADLQKQIFDLISLPESKANIANINSTIANRGSNDTNDLSSLLALLGLGNTTPAYVGTGDWTPEQ